MSDILIKNGTVIDPASGLFDVNDIMVEGGRISAVGADLRAHGARVIDAAGMWVAPGFFDAHVHFREPGFSHKETIATGAAAAARGGFTTVCCMANTEPVIDNPALVSDILTKAAASPVNILQFGAATLSLCGKEIADMEGMARAGISAISDDGKTVADAGLYLEVLKRAKALGLTVFSHCEDLSLGSGAISEETIVARDIMLAEAAGARLHICHISTARSLDLVRLARARGISVTCEITPHHLTLSSEDIPGDDANFKMSPPLRSREDVLALREALVRHIDCIATDHAPHSAEDKRGGFARAANGVVGLETAFSVCYTGLVRSGVLSPPELIRKMSYAPAQILGTNKGTLAVGADADIVILDPSVRHSINAADFASKGRNTPWDGRDMWGLVRMTILGGAVVYEHDVDYTPKRGDGR